MFFFSLNFFFLFRFILFCCSLKLQAVIFFFNNLVALLFWVCASFYIDTGDKKEKKNLCQEFYLKRKTENWFYKSLNSIA